MNIAPPKKNVLGVCVTDVSKQDVLKYITKSLEDEDDSYYIVTPNPEIVVFAQRNKSFQEALNQARIALPDGVGLLFAARILGIRLQQRITGTDVLEDICREVSKKPITVGFLGGRGGVAEKTAERLVGKYPGLRVSFIGEEWGKDGFKDAQKISNFKFLPAGRQGQISNSVDMLFVAFGFPKQEEWMWEHLGKIPARVMMGVGGAFDFLSGSVPRAPRFLRVVGLEWLCRLALQPWRLKRQLALLAFVAMVFRERLRIFSSR
ncbi:MAG: WecB/TagA/CpsF family glycosyltransferase [bacterium]|nr:WecB/TagA/CpsF family glycosyltransferase [bacterium]